VVEVGRETFQVVPGRGDERFAERQVFDRVAGEHHLGEAHEMRLLFGRAPDPAVHGGGVTGDVTNRRVDLGEGDPQRRHDGHPI
jgi:hypothetical protein